MTKKVKNDFPFYDALYYFYKEYKGTIKRHYKDITKKVLDFNDKSKNPNAYLRKPQFEALEMYVFIKEFLNNQQMCDLFEKWYHHRAEFEKRNNYEGFGQISLFDLNTAEIYSDVFDLLKSQEQIYSNYIYALTMGVGKTYLIATCILYEFLLASKFPKDERFCHNALVFAPDKTVLQSLKSIKDFDFSKVIPEPYNNFLISNVKFHFLDDNTSTLNTIDGSDFNVIISNTQKIILKKVHKDINPVDKLFSQQISLDGLDDFTKAFYDDIDLNKDESDITINQRFEKIIRLKQLGVYVDEAHHLFGSDLKKALSDSSKETSLRYTINEIARILEKQGSKLVACYNYTGTPYVDNRILPEVVYTYGLRDAIDDGYLKQVYIDAYENVKNEEFLSRVLKEFFKDQKDKLYEGLKPKIAIFGATIDEVINDIKPTVESVLSDIGVDINTILVNVGDSTITKDSDINDFNNLDIVGSEGNDKQVLLLVNKGKEGWDCRSLFSVALYRSPKSNVFVLQSTMRCLRSITETQQAAKIYLSKDNYDILDSELKKNFNIDIKRVVDKPEKQDYLIKIIKPDVELELTEIDKVYELVKNSANNLFKLDISHIDLEKYVSKVLSQRGIENKFGTTVKEITTKDDVNYSLYMMIYEIARYLNESPLKIENIISQLDNKKEILETVSKHNEFLYDEIIPKLFDYLYCLNEKIETNTKAVKLIKYPKGEDHFTFRSKKELSISVDDPLFRKYLDKSFQVNRYCFDSNAEEQLFIKLLENDNVEKVYFTGMFSGSENGLSVEYIDPTSQVIRHYYPDFLVYYKDKRVQIIEVKGDNKIDDEIVMAKALAASELASQSKMEYKLIKSSDIMAGRIML